MEGKNTSELTKSSLDLPRAGLEDPVELEGEVESTGYDDHTEVVDDQVTLGDGDHHAIFLLEVAEHLEHVESCQAVADYGGDDHGAQVHHHQQHDVGRGLPDVANSLARRIFKSSGISIG